MDKNRGKHIVRIVVLITIGVIYRLTSLSSYSSNQFLDNEFNKRVQKEIVTPYVRGSIMDRNGEQLAISTPMISIWTNNKLFLSESNSAKIIKLNKLLVINTKELAKKKPNSTYFFLKRGIPPQLLDEINELDIDGLNTISEDKRFYPYGNYTSHVVGFTNIDDKGIDGIEYALNDKLKGADGYKFTERTPKGVVGEYKTEIPVKEGENINLSIDANIQKIVYQQLNSQMKKVNALASSAVVLDAKTGEILAMVNLPDYNPNKKQTMNQQNIKNSGILNVYDPGSIIKPIVIAKALDDGIIKPNTVFDTHPYYVGPKLIKDDHAYSSMTVTEIITHSSDVGTSKIALKYNPSQLYSYYKSVGFGTKLKTGFPGETNGILLPERKWTKVDQALMSYGYGISVSLLQMAHSYLIFTNNGCQPDVTFLKESQSNISCKQIIKPSTAQIMRDILMSTTEDGTAKNAKVVGLKVAGKTGTAQKLIKGKYYNNKHIASFVGFAPADKPKYIVAIMFDEPKNGYYGAQIAAPVFSGIITDLYR